MAAEPFSRRSFNHRSRSSERRIFELCCKVTAARGSRPRLQYASDVSSGGVWLRTLLPLKVGEQVVVSLPDERDEMSLFAEVVRVVHMRDRSEHTRPGMALRFVGMNGQEEQRLEAYLDALPPKQNAFKDVLAWHFRAASA